MQALEPLWQIEEELAALIDSVETCPDELRLELEQRIARYLGAEIEKVDRVGAVLASLEAVQANAKAEIDRLKERQAAAERAEKRLESYVLHLIHQRGGRPLKGQNTTLSARTTEALVIIDPEQVPSKFKRTTVTFDVPKNPIKQALKDGETVKGVVLETHTHLVRK